MKVLGGKRPLVGSEGEVESGSGDPFRDRLGMRNVSTEVNLTVLAYNLKGGCNLVGVNNLIAAVS